MKLITDRLGNVIPVSHIVKVSEVKETNDSFNGKRSTFSILITTGEYVYFNYESKDVADAALEKIIYTLDTL